MVFQAVVFHPRKPSLFISYLLVRIPGSTSSFGVRTHLRVHFQNHFIAALRIRHYTKLRHLCYSPIDVPEVTLTN
jgi:hypothetical protein